MRYRVTREVRQIGAIGVYTEKAVIVDCPQETITQALDYSFVELHEDGYETRFPLKVEREIEGKWVDVTKEAQS
jgi:hypothetical protein